MEAFVGEAASLSALHALVQHFDTWKKNPALTQLIFQRFCELSKDSELSHVDFGTPDFWAQVLGEDFDQQRYFLTLSLSKYIFHKCAPLIQSWVP